MPKSSSVPADQSRYGPVAAADFASGQSCHRSCGRQASGSCESAALALESAVRRPHQCRGRAVPFVVMQVEPRGIPAGGRCPVGYESSWQVNIGMRVGLEIEDRMPIPIGQIPIGLLNAVGGAHPNIGVLQQVELFRIEIGTVDPALEIGGLAKSRSVIVALRGGACWANDVPCSILSGVALARPMPSRAARRRDNCRWKMAGSDSCNRAAGYSPLLTPLL